MKVVPQSSNVFELLHQNLQDAIKSVGFTKPTEVQQKTMPIALAGKDVCGIAKTGQGKTASYVLPALNHLLQKPQAYHTLVIAPTRELAIQIMEVFMQFGKSSGLRVSILVGGIDMSRQQIELAKKPHIIIGTPGRILDHFANTKGFNLAALKFLILDECDKLLDMDFERDLDQIIKKLNKARQTLLFTATFSNKIKLLKERVSSGQVIQLSTDDNEKTNAELKQLMAVTPQLDKLGVTIQLLNEFRLKTIIFCNKVVDVSKIYHTLKQMKFNVSMLHGQMSQEARLQNLKQFKDQSTKILVATDVAARGLDIDDVEFIINYSIPQIAKEYIHRVGRTARAGNAGLSMCIVTQTDIAAFQAIEDHTGVQMEKYQYDKNKVNQLRDEVNAAVKVAEQVIKGKVKDE
ncbi:ATP-dependent_rRNA helicase RRP3 [Hexamita inflata]|uniref:ATP-dependent rRNA helicase RRP3 n=1 Tax=Hexamita inflata TaxID=28002 RepID=A0AA86PBW5_9EUKA|nr:ATP-dependent rRNA helicase RRP3 [Hexamita inflata]CAI9934668.1 ATP-dependent rRNA helicase RRP3 [Hexamita inflata]